MWGCSKYVWLFEAETRARAELCDGTTSISSGAGPSSSGDGGPPGAPLWIGPLLYVSNLPGGKWYGFDLTVQKGSRNATTRVVLRSIPHPIPMVRIIVPEAVVIARANKLGLQMETEPGMQVQWSVRNGTGADPIQLNEKTLASPTSTGRTLVLAKNVLKAGASYIFRVEAWDPSAPAWRGSSEITIRVAPEPCCGTCAVSPLNGTELETQFSFMCTSFAEGEQPVTYQYAVLNADGSRSWLQLVSQTTSFFAATLGAGAEASGFIQKVFVVVAGPYGETTERSTAVEVRPKFIPDSPTAQVDYVNSILNTTVAGAMALGDTAATIRVVSIVANILNRTQNSEAAAAAAAEDRRAVLPGEAEQTTCSGSCGHGSCFNGDNLGWRCQCVEGYAGVTCNMTTAEDAARKQAREAMLSAIDTVLNQTTVEAPTVFQGYLEVVHSCYFNSRLADPPSFLDR